MRDRPTPEQLDEIEKQSGSEPAIRFLLAELDARGFEHGNAIAELAIERDKAIAERDAFIEKKISEIMLDWSDKWANLTDERDKAIAEQDRLRAVVDSCAKVFKHEFMATVAIVKPENEWDEYDSMMIPLYRDALAKLAALEARDET